MVRHERETESHVMVWGEGGKMGSRKEHVLLVMVSGILGRVGTKVSHVMRTIKMHTKAHGLLDGTLDPNLSQKYTNHGFTTPATRATRS